MLIVIAPNMRCAEQWCRDIGIPPRSRDVLLVTRSDKLRGVGTEGNDFVRLHGPPYHNPEDLECMIRIIQARGTANSWRDEVV